MKKLLCLLLALLLVPAFSLADIPDISGLTFDELVQLREQLNYAIWTSEDFQMVYIPAGLWEIGKDIPAGHWTIEPAYNIYAHVWYGDKINDSHTDVGRGWDMVNGWNGILSSRMNADGTWMDPDRRHSLDIVMKEGWYFLCNAEVIFMSHTGQTDFNFK